MPLTCCMVKTFFSMKRFCLFCGIKTLIFDLTRRHVTSHIITPQEAQAIVTLLWPRPPEQTAASYDSKYDFTSAVGTYAYILYIYFINLL